MQRRLSPTNEPNRCEHCGRALTTETGDTCTRLVCPAPVSPLPQLEGRMQPKRRRGWGRRGKNGERL